MLPAFFSTYVTVFFGGIITSKSPFFAVAVCASTSLFTSSRVSPTLAVASAREITRFSTVIVMVAACTGTAIAQKTNRHAIRRGRPGMIDSLLQFRRDMLGVLLMALKDLQPGLQQALQLGIAR